MTGLAALGRRMGVRPGEGALVFLSGLYFFLLLGSYFLLRPIREQYGVEGGLETLPWLFLGTLLGMVALNPVFGALVARWPRTRFIPWIYRFFALNLVAFFALFQVGNLDPIWVGRVFYVWLSVFNLFAVSIFRQLMADCWSPEQGKRLYGVIGVGGTLGAIVGSLAMTRLEDVAGALGMSASDVLAGVFLLAAIGLEGCVQVLRALERRFADMPRPPDAPAAEVARRRVGGDALQGLREVARSGFLLRICGYLFLGSLLGTTLYFVQAKVVGEYATTRAERTELFGWLNLAQQGLTLLLQLFLTGRFIAWVGVGGAIALYPLLTAVGLGALAWLPALVGIVVVQVLRRGSQFGLVTPAMESLFTLVPRTQKYKAKAFIDTAVKRGGDVTGAALELALKGSQHLRWLILGGVVACGIWLGFALALGREARRRSAASAASDPSAS